MTIVYRYQVFKDNTKHQKLLFKRNDICLNKGEKAFYTLAKFINSKMLSRKTKAVCSYNKTNFKVWMRDLNNDKKNGKKTEEF